MYEGPDGLIYGSRAHYEKATEYWGMIDTLDAKLAMDRELRERRLDRVNDYLAIRARRKTNCVNQMNFEF